MPKHSSEDEVIPYEPDEVPTLDGWRMQEKEDGRFVWQFTAGGCSYEFEISDVGTLRNLEKMTGKAAEQKAETDPRFDGVDP